MRFAASLITVIVLALLNTANAFASAPAPAPAPKAKSPAFCAATADQAFTIYQNYVISNDRHLYSFDSLDEIKIVWTHPKTVNGHKIDNYVETATRTAIRHYDQNRGVSYHDIQPYTGDSRVLAKALEEVSSTDIDANKPEIRFQRKLITFNFDFTTANQNMIPAHDDLPPTFVINYQPRADAPQKNKLPYDGTLYINAYTCRPARTTGKGPINGFWANRILKEVDLDRYYSDSLEHTFSRYTHNVNFLKSGIMSGGVMDITIVHQLNEKSVVIKDDSGKFLTVTNVPN